MTTHLEALEIWNNVPWKKFYRIQKNIQEEIYKASQDNDVNKIKKLQEILIVSESSRYLAVKQVTEMDTFKNVPGIDQVRKLTALDKIYLANSLENLKEWQYQPLRDLFILQVNGKRKLVSLSTIKDRAVECLIKFALEPVYEAYASVGSYGFRVMQNPWDLQKILYESFKVLSTNRSKQILEVDLHKVLEDVHYMAIINKIILPYNAKSILLSGLRAGILQDYIRDCNYTYRISSISPLIVNILLNGIEDITNANNSSPVNYSKNRQPLRYIVQNQRGFRYGHKLFFIMQPYEKPENLVFRLNTFLSIKGLDPEKINFSYTPIINGFNFLDWHFKVKAKNNKFVCYPSKDSCIRIKSTIKNIMRNTKYKLEDRLSLVKIEYVKWRIYNQYCDMRQVQTRLWYMSKWTYKYGKKLISKQKRETRAASKEKLLLRVKDIFNGHTYKINGYQPKDICVFPYSIKIQKDIESLRSNIKKLKKNKV